MKKIVAVLTVSALMGITGCTSYYVVKDPATGATYYTTDIDEIKGGAIKLKDQKTSATVRIQNSEVREVSSSEFKAALSAPTEKKVKPVTPVNNDETTTTAPKPAEPDTLQISDSPDRK